MKLPVESLIGQRMNAPDMRSVNGIQLLNLIRERGPVSRAALAKISGLSKPTVSEQVNRLIAFGVVVETGTGDAGEAGGKRPTLVAFNAAAGRVAGVGIGAASTRAAITDLRGAVLRETVLETSPELGPRSLTDRLERALASLAGRNGGTIRAIGIGVPGRVDCGSGVVLESGSVFKWKDVDLRTPLAKRFGCPVRVDNDVNVALVAELHRGAAKDANTAVLIRAAAGIGSAVAIGRRIHHGAHWAAGEIGHLAAEGRAPKHVSVRGQLELVLGADRIAQRVRSAARRSGRLRRLLKDKPEIPALFAAAAEADAEARNIVDDLAHHAALAVANQALAYDPDVILLSGQIFGEIMPEIRRFLSRTVPWSLRVQAAAFAEEGVLAGAVDNALLAAYERMARDLSTDEAPGRSAAVGA